MSDRYVDEFSVTEVQGFKSRHGRSQEGGETGERGQISDMRDEAKYPDGRRKTAEDSEYLSWLLGLLDGHCCERASTSRQSQFQPLRARPDLYLLPELGGRTDDVAPTTADELVWDCPISVAK